MIRPSRHNYAFDPSLISQDNAAEDFWQEYRRKQGLLTDEEKRQLWSDSHMRFHFPGQFQNEAAKEAQFIQDVERMRAANPPKRFSWKVLGMLLLAFVLAMACAYLGLNGGEW